MVIRGSRARALRFRVFFLLAILAFYLCVVPVHQAVQAQFAEAALGLATLGNPYFLAFAGLCVAGGYLYYDWTHDGPVHQWWERSQAWGTLTRAFLLGAFREWVETPDAVLDISVPYSMHLDSLSGAFTEAFGHTWSHRSLGDFTYMSTDAVENLGVGTTVIEGFWDKWFSEDMWFYPDTIYMYYTRPPSTQGNYQIRLIDPAGTLRVAQPVVPYQSGDSVTYIYYYDSGNPILPGLWRLEVYGIAPDGIERRFEVRTVASVRFSWGAGTPLWRYPGVLPLPPIDWDYVSGQDVGLTVPAGWGDIVDVAMGDFPDYSAPYAVPVSTWPGTVVHPDTGAVSGGGTVVIDPPVTDTSGWDAWFAGLQGTLDWIAVWAQSLAADLAERWMSLNSRLGTISANVASLAAQFGTFMVALPTLPAQIAAAGVNAWADFLQPENPLGPRVESLKTSALGRFPLGLIPLISGLAGTFFAAECGGHTFTMGVPASPWAIEVDLPTEPAWAVNTKALSRVAVAVMAVTYLIGLGRRFLGLGG